MASMFLALCLGLLLSMGRWLVPVALVVAVLVCPVAVVVVLLTVGGAALFRKDH